MFFLVYSICCATLPQSRDITLSYTNKCHFETNTEEIKEEKVFVFLSVRLLSILRRHSVFPYPHNGK